MKDICTKKQQRTTSSMSVLLTLFAFAVMLRFAYILRLDNSTIGTWGDQGADIALNMLRGNGYITSYGILEDFRSFRVPGLPVLLWALWKVFGFNILLTKLFMAVISAATCVLTVMLGEKLFDSRVGMMAGIFLSILPASIRWTGTLGPETLATFLLVLGTLLFQNKSRLSWCTSGAVFGLLTLTRVAFLPLAPLTFLFLNIGNSNRRANNFRTSGIFLCACLAVMSIWTVRNYITHQSVVIASTEGGITFLEANNPVAWHKSNSNWVPGYAQTLPEVKSAAKTLPEVPLDRLMWRQGIDYVRADPTAYGRAMLLRIMYFWQPVPHMRGDISQKHAILLGLIWTPLLTLALICLVKNRLWNNDTHLPILVSILCLMVSSALIWSQSRYRAPIEPFLLIYAAAAINSLWQKIKSEDRVLEECGGAVTKTVAKLRS